ncbi:WYL domain-containing protein [Senegalimassilia faecalis]|nr:WYL domain-containing protein [Senegalimassilia faecalis]
MDKSKHEGKSTEAVPQGLINCNDIENAKNKIAFLCIEKILLEYTNYDRKLDVAINDLSVTEIQTKLYELYSLKCSPEFVSKSIDALIAFYGKCDAFAPDGSSYTIPAEVVLNKVSKSEKKAKGQGVKQYYSISHSLSKAEVEYLVQQCRNRNDSIDAEETVKALKALVNVSDRAVISDVSPSSAQVSLTELLRTISEIEKAISRCSKVSFIYDGRREKPYLPLYLGCDDGRYYLIALARNAKRPNCLPLGNGIREFRHLDGLGLFRILRVDKIKEIGPLLPAAGWAQENYDALRDLAKLYLDTSVNGLPSVDIRDVKVKCHKAAKEDYLISKFVNHGCNKVDETDAYSIYEIRNVSIEGMKVWALGWIDCFEVVEPIDLAEEIKAELSNNVYTKNGEKEQHSSEE